MPRQIIIYRSIPGSSISERDFDRINDLSDSGFLFTLVDSPEIDSRHGWFISEPINETTQKIYKSLPGNTTIDQVLAMLLSIKRGDNGPGKSTPLKDVQFKDEDILIDLNSDGGEYKPLFPLLTIANAPQWLVNLLNTLTGHGLLSLYVWLGISAIVASKMAMNKKRSAICWLILGLCLKMTYDSYRLRQSHQNKNA